MGLGGISIWQLLIVLAIVVMLFGTKRLRTLGSDVGEAIKGFRNSVSDKEKDADALEQQAGDVIEGEAQKTEKSEQQ